MAPTSSAQQRLPPYSAPFSWGQVWNSSPQMEHTDRSTAQPTLTSFLIPPSMAAISSRFPSVRRR